MDADIFKDIFLKEQNEFRSKFHSSLFLWSQLRSLHWFRHRTGDKLLPELMVIQVNDAYLRHSPSMRNSNLNPPLKDVHQVARWANAFPWYSYITSTDNVKSIAMDWKRRCLKTWRLCDVAGIQKSLNHCSTTFWRYVWYNESTEVLIWTHSLYSPLSATSNHKPVYINQTFLECAVILIFISIVISFLSPPIRTGTILYHSMSVTFAQLFGVILFLRWLLIVCRFSLFIYSLHVCHIALVLHWLFWFRKCIRRLLWIPPG